MNSQFYIPTEPRFRHLIQSAWQLEGNPAFQREYIIPKGIIEVIVNLSESPVSSSLGDQPYQLPTCFINGFSTKPIQTELPERQLFFGIVFQPHAIRQVFKIKGYELANKIIDLQLILPGFRFLCEQFAEQLSFPQRIRILLGWLGQFSPETDNRAQLMNQFLQAENQQLATVNVWAKTLCYSPRHLSRKISELTGLNAEDILLYKKYLHTVSLMHDPKLSLTQIAYRSGFTDQSHFIRTFKSFTGITPGTYQRNRSSLKGHLFEDVR
ncbi:MAG: hypothetical protein JWQ27_678 [Ferruginibacter sp.]|nr:hypothetical protein [Ferruginibacter sp.]